jgi:hypothetical protein
MLWVFERAVKFVSLGAELGRKASKLFLGEKVRAVTPRPAALSCEIAKINGGHEAFSPTPHPLYAILSQKPPANPARLVVDFCPSPDRERDSNAVETAVPE